ncbi:KRFD protein, partial [Melanocharis versteri]|nr:KRFD protein [Melanocharis versteri]
CPQPLANARSGLCVTRCGDSRAVIHPPPVVLTFPGPILSSCPQDSVVGSRSPPAPGRPGASPGPRSSGSAAGL